MTNPRSPLRYPGGKNCLFPFVANLFCENGLCGCPYVEPFAGGAGLALRLLFEEYVPLIYINDFDPLIYAFWKSAIEESDRFCEWIERTTVTTATWQSCKNIIGKPNGHSMFDLGTSAFFLNRTNVSGVLNGGIIGGLDQRGSYKINARYNKSQLIERIHKIGRFRQRIKLSNLDGIVFLERLNKSSEKLLIYLDPPYYEKGSGLYLNAYREKDHMELAKMVKHLSKPWIMSYDNHAFISALYRKYATISYSLQHSTSNKIGQEILIFCDQIKFDSSLSFLSNPEPVGQLQDCED